MLWAVCFKLEPRTFTQSSILHKSVRGKQPMTRSTCRKQRALIWDKTRDTNICGEGEILAEPGPKRHMYVVQGKVLNIFYVRWRGTDTLREMWLTDWTLRKPKRREGLRAAAVLLGASADGGAVYMMVGSERTAAEGDFSESRSGITEAFPVHIITHAFRGRVGGGGGGLPISQQL